MHLRESRVLYGSVFSGFVFDFDFDLDLITFGQSQYFTRRALFAIK